MKKVINIFFIILYLTGIVSAQSSFEILYKKEKEEKENKNIKEISEKIRWSDWKNYDYKFDLKKLGYYPVNELGSGEKKEVILPNFFYDKKFTIEYYFTNIDKDKIVPNRYLSLDQYYAFDYVVDLALWKELNKWSEEHKVLSFISDAVISYVIFKGLVKSGGKVYSGIKGKVDTEKIKQNEIVNFASNNRITKTLGSIVFSTAPFLFGLLSGIPISWPLVAFAIGTAGVMTAVDYFSGGKAPTHMLPLLAYITQKTLDSLTGSDLSKDKFVINLDPTTFDFLTKNIDNISKQKLQTELLYLEPYKTDSGKLKQDNWKIKFYDEKGPWNLWDKFIKMYENGEIKVNLKQTSADLTKYISILELMNDYNKYISSPNFISDKISKINKDKFNNDWQKILDFINEENIGVYTSEFKKEDIYTTLKNLKQDIEELNKLISEINGRNIENIESEKLNKLIELENKVYAELNVIKTISNVLNKAIDKIKESKYFNDLFDLGTYKYLIYFDGKFSEDEPIDLVIEDTARAIDYITDGKIIKPSMKTLETLCKIYEYRKDVIEKTPELNLLSQDISNDDLIKIINMYYKERYNIDEFETIDKSLLGDGFISVGNLLGGDEKLNKVEKICNNGRPTNKNIEKVSNVIKEISDKYLEKLKQSAILKKEGPNLEDLKKLNNEVKEKISLVEKLCVNPGNYENECNQTMKLIDAYKKHTVLKNIPERVVDSENVFLQGIVLGNEITGRYYLTKTLLEILNERLEKVINDFANTQLVLVNKKDAKMSDYIYNVELKDDYPKFNNFVYREILEIIPLIPIDIENGKYLGTDACSVINLGFPSPNVKIVKTNLDILKYEVRNNKLVLCYKTLKHDRNYTLELEWNDDILQIANTERKFSTVFVRSDEGEKTITITESRNILFDDRNVRDFISKNPLKLKFIYDSNYENPEIKVDYKKDIELINKINNDVDSFILINETKDYKREGNDIINVIKLSFDPLAEQELYFVYGFISPNIKNISLYINGKIVPNANITVEDKKGNKLIIVQDNILLDKKTTVEIKYTYVDIKGWLSDLRTKLSSLKEYKPQPLGDENEIFKNKISEMYDNLRNKILLAEKFLNKKDITEDDLINADRIIYDAMKLKADIDNLIISYKEIENKIKYSKELCNKLGELEKYLNINTKMNLGEKQLVIDYTPLKNIVEKYKNKFCKIYDDLSTLKNTKVNVKSEYIKFKSEFDKERDRIDSSLKEVISYYDVIKKKKCYFFTPVNVRKELETQIENIRLYLIDDSLESTKKLSKIDFDKIKESFERINNICKNKNYDITTYLKEIDNYEKEIKELKKKVEMLKPTARGYEICIQNFDKEECDRRQEYMNKKTEEYMKKLKVIESIIYNNKKLLNEIKTKDININPQKIVDDLREVNKTISDIKPRIEKTIKNLANQPENNEIAVQFKEQRKLGDFFLVNQEKSNGEIWLFIILLLLSAIGGVGYYLYRKGYLDEYLEKYFGKKREDNEEEDLSIDDINELKNEDREESSEESNIENTEESITETEINTEEKETEEKNREINVETELKSEEKIENEETKTLDNEEKIQVNVSVEAEIKRETDEKKEESAENTLKISSEEKVLEKDKEEINKNNKEK